ncbi:hypothetical protein [Streptomyces sp. NPDC050535]|uniref:hypothetical protein n=1 Tax=Streptomyces sp. NPDC050535 TaxID=3365626 RepID=UPI00379336A0
MIWTFDLTGERDLTADELSRMDHTQEFGDGYITPEYSAGHPVIFHIDFPADSHEDAVEAASEAIRQIGYDAGLTVTQ